MGDEYIAYVLCSRRRSYSDLSKSGKSAIKKSRILFVSNVAIVKIIFFSESSNSLSHYFYIFWSLWIMPFAYTYDMKKKIKDS